MQRGWAVQTVDGEKEEEEKQSQPRPKHVENREDGSGGVRRKNGERLSAMVDGASQDACGDRMGSRSCAITDGLEIVRSKDIQTGHCGVVQMELLVCKFF